MEGNLETVLESTRMLSIVEKVKLIQQLTAQIESEIKITQNKQRKSLRGLWRGLDIKEEEINKARNEMWGIFPREDI